MKVPVLPQMRCLVLDGSLSTMSIHRDVTHLPGSLVVPHSHGPCNICWLLPYIMTSLHSWLETTSNPSAFSQPILLYSWAHRDLSNALLHSSGSTGDSGGSLRPSAQISPLGICHCQTILWEGILCKAWISPQALVGKGSTHRLLAHLEYNVITHTCSDTHTQCRDGRQDTGTLFTNG